MYITYTIYRSKNGDKIDTRKIELPIGDFRQLLHLDHLLSSVITQDINSISIIKKFGTAYIGKIECNEIEILDKDNTDEMNEEQFREYFKTVSDTPLKWSKKEIDNNGKEDTNKGSERKTRKSNSKKVGNEEKQHE